MVQIHFCEPPHLSLSPASRHGKLGEAKGQSVHGLVLEYVKVNSDIIFDRNSPLLWFASKCSVLVWVWCAQWFHTEKDDIKIAKTFRVKLNLICSLYCKLIIALIPFFFKDRPISQQEWHLFPSIHMHVLTGKIPILLRSLQLQNSLQRLIAQSWWKQLVWPGSWSYASRVHVY